MISSCIPLAWARLPSWSCSASLVRHAVPGLVDGDADCAVVDGLGRHGDGSLVEVDGDVLDPGEPSDLAGDRVDAVLAGHALDGVRAGSHRGVLLGVVYGGWAQDRTRRPMAADASLTLSSASAPPAVSASLTQCSRWSSSSSRATAWRALVAAEIWVRTSMQYWSSSTIRCRPRTCPSIRRSRLSTLSLSVE